jgi:NADH-quinone oxidoreductase subunit N
VTPLLVTSGPTGVVSLDWWSLTPALAPAAGALLVLLVDAMLPRRRSVHVVIAAVALLVGAAAALPGALGTAAAPVRTLCVAGTTTCFWMADPVSSTLQIGLLGASLAAVLLMLSRLLAGSDSSADDAGEPQRGGTAVTVALMLAAATGGASVAAAGDIPAWLVSLELATLPVVALVALRGSRAAGHGALAFLTTSLVSFALLVLGSALWVTATTQPTFSTGALRQAWDVPERRALLIVAVVVIVAGIGFKLSAVPFHAWTPQAYGSAGVPVAALLASASKIAALAALVMVLRPFSVLVGSADAPHSLAFVLALLAVSSMLVGNVVALRQDDAVRLLAWSTVAQAGWVVLPLAALTSAGRSAAAAYVLTYAAATLVAFAAVSSVVALSRPDGAATPTVTGPGRGLAAYTGLLRSAPTIGVPLALALFVLAGLPPGVIGLLAKVVAMKPIVGVQLWPLAVVAVVAAVLGIAVYVRWVAVLFAGPEPQDGGEALVARSAGVGNLAVLGIGTVILVAMSVLPQLLLGLVE